MKTIGWMAGAVAVLVAWASPAQASDSSLESRVARVEQQLAATSEPSSREIQSAVDAYLGSARADASLVGGPGAAGYDGGFWIRGGTFLLKINLTIQTRYETFRWEDESDEPSPGGSVLPPPYATNAVGRNARVIHALIDDDSIAPGREGQAREAMRFLASELAPALRPLLSLCATKTIVSSSVPGTTVARLRSSTRPRPATSSRQASSRTASP